MPTQLAYTDRFRKKLGTPITSDTSNSVAFHSMPSTPTVYRVEWTSEQFKKLLSSVMAGADLLWSDESDEIIWQLIKAVHEIPPLDPDESGCVEYRPYTPFTKFLPDDPYIANDKDAGWNKEAWFRWGSFDTLFPDWIDNWLIGFVGDLVGYEANDILFNIESMPLNLIEIVTEGGTKFPTIEISFTGSGVIEIELLSFPLGGKCVVELDEEPNVLDILTGGVLDPNAFMVELNRDVITFPPDEYPVNNIEIKVETSGSHVLYLVFIPTLDDTLFPIGFGGGIRSIEMCGFEEVPMSGIEGLIFEDCTLKAIVAGELTPVTGFEEIYACIGDLMATKLEVKEAIIEAAEQLATQMLAGETQNMLSGFTVDKNTGEKTFSSVGESDDPDTPDIDESLASLFGGGFNTLMQVERVLDKLDTIYGAVNGTPANPESFAEVSLALLFPFDPILLEVGIANYYLFRMSNGYIAYNRSATHDQVMYCNGGGKQAWNRLLAENTGYNETKLTMVKSVTDALLPDFWDSAFEAGAKLPSSSYLDASCTPMATQVLIDVPYGSNRTLFPTLAKGGHRLRITVSGYYVDPDGDVQDAFWYRSNAGALTRSNFTFINGAGSNMPSDNQVVYRADHTYNYTIDLANGNNSWSLQFNRNANMNVSSTSPTNGFSITIEDLGAY